LVDLILLGGKIETGNHDGFPSKYRFRGFLSVVPKKQSHDQPVLEVIQAACSGDRISLG
jgi:hypothetical protein